MSALTKRDAAARRKTPMIHRGVDLEQEKARYCRHFGFKHNGELQVKHSSRVNNTHGLQWLSVTVLTIGPFETTARVLSMLLHEVCHAAVPVKSSDVQETHPPEYNECLVFAARDIWGIDIEGWQSVKQGGETCLAYALTDFIENRLKAHLNAGRYVPVQAAP